MSITEPRILKGYLSLNLMESQSIEQAIGLAISTHQHCFYDYFKSLISVDATEFTIVASSLVVKNLDINRAKAKVVVAFQSEYFNGCQGRHSIDDHTTELDFLLVDNNLRYELELLPEWLPD